MMETKTGSRLRRVVGRMRTDLAAASAARDAHLDRVRRFLAGPGESAPFPEDAAAPVPVPDDEDAAEPPRAVRETERDRRVLEPFAEAREDPEKIPPARLGMAREESPSRGSAVAGTSTDPDGDPLGAALGLPASPERFAAARRRVRSLRRLRTPRRSLREASSSDGASGLDRRGRTRRTRRRPPRRRPPRRRPLPRARPRLREQWEAFILSKMRRAEEATLTSRRGRARGGGARGVPRGGAARARAPRAGGGGDPRGAGGGGDGADRGSDPRGARRGGGAEGGRRGRSRRASRRSGAAGPRVEALAAEARAVRRSDSRRALESLAAQSAMEARLDRDSGASLAARRSTATRARRSGS